MEEFQQLAGVCLVWVSRCTCFDKPASDVLLAASWELAYITLTSSPGGGGRFTIRRRKQKAVLYLQIFSKNSLVPNLSLQNEGDFVECLRGDRIY
jgi:hypothetical protein